MTYSIKNFVNLRSLRLGGDAARKGFFGTKQALFGSSWQEDGIANTMYTYLWGAHCGHTLEFLVALLCYFLLYYDGTIMADAKEWQLGWVSKIVAFNLCCELVLCNGWHYMTYSWTEQRDLLRPKKFNPANQYEPSWGPVSMCWSSTGNLQREITFNTLGWLQSAAWQCVLTHLWAAGDLPFYNDFWAYPVYSLFVLAAVTYWREVHFYFAHRNMHPWWDRSYGILQGDVGAFLYRHAHSLHHKSYNPGPWSGLSMHPVEHLLYYTCATMPPLFLAVHPLHFLYAKFHADIAPIGGHDGHDAPGGNGDFHWLHHAKFECNYGVPWPVNLDKIFGTWVEYKDYKETGEIKASAKAMAMMHEPEEDEVAWRQAAKAKLAPASDKEAPLLETEAPSPAKMGENGLPIYTIDDVAKHKTRDNCWIVLHGKVLDVSTFLKDHPGGEAVILGVAGKDNTDIFDTIHQSSGGFDLINKWAPKSIIGELDPSSTPSAPQKQRVGSEECSRVLGALWNALCTVVTVIGSMYLVLYIHNAAPAPQLPF